MARRRPAERHIFFPWERRGGIFRRVRIDQVGPVLGLGALLTLVTLVAIHERQQAGIRRTRATILNVRTSVDAYLSDHDGGCPAAGLERMVNDPDNAGGPRDAWGKPLRLACPGAEHARYDLFSDGPDGKPGGLDRIE
jgi:general secretion pathway protein G